MGGLTDSKEWINQQSEISFRKRLSCRRVESESIKVRKVSGCPLFPANPSQISSKQRVACVDAGSGDSLAWTLFVDRDDSNAEGPNLR
jgi:hypothetical protein